MARGAEGDPERLREAERGIQMPREAERCGGGLGSAGLPKEAERERHKLSLVRGGQQRPGRADRADERRIGAERGQ